MLCGGKNLMLVYEERKWVGPVALMSVIYVVYVKNVVGNLCFALMCVWLPKRVLPAFHSLPLSNILPRVANHAL